MGRHDRRRFLLIVPAVLSLTLAGAAPAFGQAYGGGPSLDCEEGVVVGDHFRPGSSPGVFVDGQLVGHAQVDEDGTFAFPLPSSIGAGTHTVTVAGASAGIRCGTEVEGSVVTPPSGSSGTAGTAFTGADVALLALLGAALIGTGLVLVGAGRRRRGEEAGGGRSARP